MANIAQGKAKCYIIVIYIQVLEPIDDIKV